MRSVFETLALADPKTLDLEQCGLMDMVNVLYYVCIESKHFRTRATNWIAHVFLFACCFIHTHTHDMAYSAACVAGQSTSQAKRPGARMLRPGG